MDVHVNVASGAAVFHANLAEAHRAGPIEEAVASCRAALSR